MTRHTPHPTPILGAPHVDPGMQKFGDYYLVSKLAKGGMAEIFLAKRFAVGGFERNVVIKRMLDDLTSEPEFVSMFLDEARLAAKLTHPTIAQITDFGVIDDRYFICMEHIAGEDLRAIVAKCRDLNIDIPLDVALRIMLPVCEGLEYAHDITEDGRRLNIVHRDVSPSNVMVSYQGSVKLLDFGIAKATSRVAETTSGKLKGKITFMAPEQINGQTVDGRADVFALGLTFFELLTKQRVFHRDTEMASLNAVLNARIPKPTEFRPDVPPDVEAIIMRALERDLEARYPNAGAMRGDLQTALARIDTEPGTRKLADFMLSLFGREQMQRRSSIPSLLAPIEESADLPPSRDSNDRAAAIASTMMSTSSVTARAIPPSIKAALFAGGAIAVVGLAALVLTLRARPLLPIAPAMPTVTTPTAAVAPPALAPVAPAVATQQPKPAAPPQAKVALAPAPQLTPAVIGGVLTKARPRLLACFEQHRATLPAKEGQVELVLTVAQPGNITDAQVSTPGIKSNELSGCLNREIKRIKFPRHRDKELKFRVPFVYRVQ